MAIIDSVQKKPEKMSLEQFSKAYMDSDGKKVLYIHTPFCPSKCKYCICRSVACSDQRKVDEYVETVLIPQIKLSFSMIKEVKFSEAYFGGGTPTYMSPESMEKVFEAIPAFREIPVKCIEGSPDTLQYEHLKLLKKYNFNFISLGIQSLQRDVCSWQNRYWLSHEQVLLLSDCLKESGMYFNYDLISYLGRGDFRDLPGFEEDLDFIMAECRPSSINIHQLHQTTYTIEKMLQLYKIIRKCLSKYPEYECINARLLDADAYEDIIYQAQYRLVREKRNFIHYMWNKFPEIPVLGYDIFAIGHTDVMTPKSNAGNLVYKPGTGEIRNFKHNIFLYNDYWAIRKEKGLD